LNEYGTCFSKQSTIRGKRTGMEKEKRQKDDSEALVKPI
jgi:hypothetical protein